MPSGSPTSNTHPPADGNPEPEAPKQAARVRRTHVGASMPTGYNARAHHPIVMATMSASVTAAAPIARLDVAAPALVLIDQRGDRFDLASWRGRPVIVTFAFAHCADICPTLVHQLREARSHSGRDTVPIVVVTLDVVVSILKNHPPKYSYEERAKAIADFNPDLVIVPSDPTLGGLLRRMGATPPEE